MRKQRFGLTIAKRLLGLALTTVFLLMLFGVMAEAQRVDLVQATSKSKSDNSDEAEMSVQVTMHAWYEKDNYTDIYEVRSNVSSDVHAAHEKKDMEYDCTEWIKGSADTYVRGAHKSNYRNSVIRCVTFLIGS